MSNEIGLIKILKWPFLGNWRTISDINPKTGSRDELYFRVPLPGLYPSGERVHFGNRAREIIWVPIWQFLLLIFCQTTEKMASAGSILGVFICGAITLYLTLGFRKCGLTFSTSLIIEILVKGFLLLERFFVLYTFIRAWRLLSLS
ncbi:hypothetical protein CYK25_001790 [Varibaculum cambriense]|uniref:hypothetical protein n=1 Tax=uncultured Varibaculum sp. TaxID=413896 RepID=UPI000C7ACA96|nr:hypothetical protein [uncultured Varibaculum sp.]WIK88958.1 hypothetical protein CYK25_001790 [Varibaculum cambriense]